MGGGDSSLETLTLNDLPAGNLAIRRAVVTMQNWNAALPRLELRDVNLELRRGDEDLSTRFQCAVCPRCSAGL